MKITNIRTRQIDIPLPEPFFPVWAPQRMEKEIRVVYVRIDTDAGIYGIAGHEFYGAEEQCLSQVAEYLLGEDPLRIEKHAGTLRYLWPYFGTAVWFVEIALWDLLGKAAGFPIYKLLGNARDEIVAYASTGQNRTPKQRADDALRLQDEGYRAIKLRIHNDKLQDDIAQVEYVRKAIGGEIAIMVDANQPNVTDAPFPGPHWDFHRALETARALAEFDVIWLEEPLPRHDYEGLAALKAASPVKIAGGEVNQTFQELQRLIVRSCYDIIQPDVTLCEGLLRLRGFASMANTLSIPVVPHTWGDPLGTVANLHLAAAVTSTSYFELPHDPPAFPLGVYQSTLKNPLVVENGVVKVPQEPGLGVELQDWVFE